MRSTDFGSIVSPLMLARDHRGRYAKGGHVRASKKQKQHLTIVLSLPALAGALAHAVALHQAGAHETPLGHAIRRRR